MKTGVTVTWSAMLAASYLVVVPTVVNLLKQSLDAAREIENYTASIREHAAGIERNVADARALKETLAVAPALVSTANSLQGHAAGIAAALGAAPRAGGNSPAPDSEVQP